MKRHDLSLYGTVGNRDGIEKTKIAASKREPARSGAAIEIDLLETRFISLILVIVYKNNLKSV
jgi:hypothetical protein